MYSIQPLQKADLSSLTDLLTSGFKILSVNKQAPLIWKYFSNKTDFPVTAYVAKVSDEVVSFYSNKVIPIRNSENIFLAGSCLDMATKPEQRRKGLIKQLSKKVYEVVAEKKQPFSFGFSNEQGVKVDQNYSGYGYFVVGKFVNIYTTILNLHFDKKSRYSLTPVTDFTQQPESYGTYFHIDPSNSYLNWRYIQRPENKYEIYELWENEHFLGYVVVVLGKYQLSVLKITANLEAINFDALLSQLRKLSYKKRKFFLNFFVLQNSFWKTVFRNKLTIKQQQPDYFLTVKPGVIDPQTQNKILKPDNWICMGGDIM